MIWRGLVFVALTVLLFAAKKNTPPVVDKPFAPLEAEWTMQEVIACTDCSYPFRNDFTSTFVWPLSERNEKLLLEDPFCQLREISDAAVGDGLPLLIGSDADDVHARRYRRLQAGDAVLKN